MKLSTSSYVITLIINAVGMVIGAPAICMMTPPIIVQAGSVITATIDNPQRNRCEATLKFTNPDFLPIHFGFQSLNCPGSQIAEITIPSEVPNGDAYILWQCAKLASPTCSRVLIAGGVEDANSIVLNQYGKINCLVPNATLSSASAPNGTWTCISTSPPTSLTFLPLITSTAPSPIVSSAPSAFATPRQSWANSSITSSANSSSNNIVTNACVMSS